MDILRAGENGGRKQGDQIEVLLCGLLGCRHDRIGVQASCNRHGTAGHIGCQRRVCCALCIIEWRSGHHVQWQVAATLFSHDTRVEHRGESAAGKRQQESRDDRSKTLMLIGPEHIWKRNYDALLSIL